MARPVIIAVVYFLLAKASMLLFAAHPANIALLWLPAGFALHVYSRWGNRVLLPLFIGGFAASFPSMGNDSVWQQVLHTAVSSGADMLFALLAGTALNRRLGGDIKEPSELFDFILYCCFFPLTASTLIIAGNLWVGISARYQQLDRKPDGEGLEKVTWVVVPCVLV